MRASAGAPFTVRGTLTLERADIERVEPAPVPLDVEPGDTVAVWFTRGSGERVEHTAGTLQSRDRYGSWGVVRVPVLTPGTVRVRLVEGAGVRVLERVERGDR